MTLREIGKDFTLDGVDLAKKRLENGDDYLAVNPKGQVPALLLDDGTLLTEGVAIMQYLADNVPDRQLLAPVSSLARYHTLEWLNYIATELHKGFTPLFRPDTPETLKPAVRAGLEKKLQYVDESLSDDQWICGQRFTIADAYLFTVLRWAYGVKLNMDGLTHIESYMQRVAKRPTVAAALKAEGLN
ncbi:glutathione transferase GstA [Salmonella enterica]|uniref:glutathione transferase GstA n=1 Tax=Salmonella enterica TaxID=28901 RepID=UPI000D03ED0D|nr:glutathione transferase GstA [Salmonella enterica]PRU13650.1 glutathione transferase GstA [Salmonella enterica subsp. enterica serovar Weltevreden]